MPVPLSNRLQLCADLVPSDARVADIGTDHGYLSIWLLQTGRAAYCAACDLRAGPLANAKGNAARAQVDKQMTFYLCDGLRDVPPESIDTVICAGMGGDLIVKILSEAPWLKDSRYTLILQPQTDIHKLRRWLQENGFREEAADLTRDNGFLYCAIRVRFGAAPKLSAGQEYVSPVLEASGSPLLGAYIAFHIATLRRITNGIQMADTAHDPERLRQCMAALRELEEMEEHYVNCS